MVAHDDVVTLPARHVASGVEAAAPRNRATFLRHSVVDAVRGVVPAAYRVLGEVRARIVLGPVEAARYALRVCRYGEVLQMRHLGRGRLWTVHHGLYDLHEVLPARAAPVSAHGARLEHRGSVMRPRKDRLEHARVGGAIHCDAVLVPRKEAENDGPLRPVYHSSVATLRQRRTEPAVGALPRNDSVDPHLRLLKLRSVI